MKLLLVNTKLWRVGEINMKAPFSVIVLKFYYHLLVHKYWYL